MFSSHKTIDCSMSYFRPKLKNDDKKYEWIAEAGIDTPENRKLIDINPEFYNQILQQIELTYFMDTPDTDFNQKLFEFVCSNPAIPEINNLEEKEEICLVELPPKTISQAQFLQFIEDGKQIFSENHFNKLLAAVNKNNDPIILSGDTLIHFVRMLYGIINYSTEGVLEMGEFERDVDAELQEQKEERDRFSTQIERARILALSLFGNEKHPKLLELNYGGRGSQFEIQGALCAPQNYLENVLSATRAIRNRFTNDEPEASHLKFICQKATILTNDEMTSLGAAFVWLQEANISTLSNQKKLAENPEFCQLLKSMKFSSQSETKFKQAIFDLADHYYSEKLRVGMGYKI